MKYMLSFFQKITVLSLILVIAQGFFFPLHAEDDDEEEHQERRSRTTQTVTASPTVQTTQVTTQTVTNQGQTLSEGELSVYQRQQLQEQQLNRLIQLQRDLDAQLNAINTNQQQLAQRELEQKQWIEKQNQLATQLDTQKASLETRQQQLAQRELEQKQWILQQQKIADELEAQSLALEEGQQQFIEESQSIAELSVQNSGQEGNDSAAVYGDSDRDGIPDTVDPHPLENELVYSIKDENKNGISDDLEHIRTVAWR